MSCIHAELVYIWKNYESQSKYLSRFIATWLFYDFIRL